ncbi:MAG: hypothetical protein A3K19_22920 [Lentisphaerae bacterium RIFOXYB12_FULL_65_16]|nr:MAG: hypothetical protein A3K18_16835 [Lentisphaerae bacterium RIFOXYA12_64_32]OGV90062.1 MAG: hypothetical protein A3K19_22920 [Lentisphaerae bacterium RIFOXYB12_FULL_65_16]
MAATADRAQGPGEVKIVALSGRLGVQAEQDLAKSLIQTLGASAGNVLLDMAAVDFVSSSGLRSLMMAYKQATAMGKKMAMTQIQPGVYKIFKLTASEGIFHIYEDRDEALAWLAE